MAVDPRLPVEAQAFEFEVQGTLASDAVEWRVDGGPAEHGGDKFLWTLRRGSHFVSASVRRDGELIANLPPVEFLVK